MCDARRACDNSVLHARRSLASPARQEQDPAAGPRGCKQRLTIFECSRVRFAALARHDAHDARKKLATHALKFEQHTSTHRAQQTKEPTFADAVWLWIRCVHVMQTANTSGEPGAGLLGAARHCWCG